jgi:hypothetical protein
MADVERSDRGLNPWHAGWRAHTVVVCWVVVAAAIAAAILPEYPTGLVMVLIMIVVLVPAFGLLIWLHKDRRSS